MLPESHNQISMTGSNSPQAFEPVLLPQEIANLRKPYAVKMDDDAYVEMMQQSTIIDTEVNQ